MPRAKKVKPKFYTFWAWMGEAGYVHPWAAGDNRRQCLRAAREFFGLLDGDPPGRPVRVVMRLAKKGAR